MDTIKDLLKSKDGALWSIGPQALVYEGLGLMAEKDIGALLVIEDTKLVGIFSERDYARKVALKGKSSKETKIHELMTKKVFYVDVSQTLKDCMAMMTDKHIRHLPIYDKDRLIGMISIGDVVKEIISDQKFTIQQLEKYITG